MSPLKHNLLGKTEDELQEMTHYELLSLEESCSQDDVKKAFRRASLKYHPDKCREEDHYVFLAIKEAHDTLFDEQKRQAYDSTHMPFDDSIPASRAQMANDPMLLYQDEDFYETFGPVFQRNLRYDARLRPGASNKKKITGSRNSNKKNGKVQAPPLGDEKTPIEEVHKFYEYWVHFESWRDFTQQATDELNVENELENAESRYERRWIQKEIDKRASKLKKTEMQRVQTLVERAIEADPRLRRERQELVAARERQKEGRRLAEKRRKQDIEDEKQRKMQEEEDEKARKAAEKAQREADKKILRKARQLLRRMASSSYNESSSDEVWSDAYDMEQDVELLCQHLSLVQLQELTTEIEAARSSVNKLEIVSQRCKSLKDGNEQESQLREKERSAAAAKNEPAPEEKRPWSKDELATLAKGAKKYPPGDPNRWDRIAQLINDKQEHARTREDCIEKFNEVTRQSKPEVQPSVNGNTATTSTTSTTMSTNEDVWTTEQDQLLQDGLKKFPASLDKNERWTSIAKCVPGKTKKQCVQRFKTIREALKNKK